MINLLQQNEQELQLNLEPHYLRYVRGDVDLLATDKHVGKTKTQTKLQ